MREEIELFAAPAIVFAPILYPRQESVITSRCEEAEQHKQMSSRAWLGSKRNVKVSEAEDRVIEVRMPVSKRVLCCVGSRYAKRRKSGNLIMLMWLKEM